MKLECYGAREVNYNGSLQTRMYMNFCWSYMHNWGTKNKGKQKSMRVGALPRVLFVLTVLCLRVVATRQTKKPNQNLYITKSKLEV